MTPDSYTISEQQLAVHDGHELYVHDWGNVDAAVPIINLHGGPGSGTSNRHKSYYDPTKQRVIFFDQRGAGRSTPYGSLKNNTTADLIHDITSIANHLNIDQFVLRGGSWGSCLALAYALAEPHRVRGLVVDGVFTSTQIETDWIDKGQFKTFYPDIWRHFLNNTPEEHHDDPTGYHVSEMFAGNVVSAQLYSELEGSVVKLDDRPSPSEPQATFDPTSTLIEQHYLSNGSFMDDRHILHNAHTISVPVVIVQGRYDMVCPPSTAYELHQLLPNSRLHWTQNGHVAEHEAHNLIKLHLELLTS